MDHRDIQNPRSFLVKSGFTYHAAGRLLRNELAGLRYLEMYHQAQEPAGGQTSGTSQVR